MTLNRASEIAACWREIGKINQIYSLSRAAVILDDRVKELEAQRDALLEAAKGVLKIVQRAYHSDDRGPGDKCSKLENAIEVTTGKKWWDAIKTRALRKTSRLGSEVMNINPGHRVGILPLYPQGTNSTMFTECCKYAICDDEPCCPSCSKEVIGYDAETRAERHRIRWKYAYKGGGE